MIYITYVDINSIAYFGIRKKIMSQIKVFQKYFGQVYYTTYCGQTMYLMDDDKVIDKEVAVTRQICNNVLSNWLDKYEIERMYIRYNLSDKWFLQFLKNKNDIKAVLEIPTYPYDGELSEGRVKIEDIYYRKQLYKYIEYVATNSNSKRVLGMKCIRLLNGVSLEENPLCLSSTKNKKIVFIAVSSLLKWHGFERVLKGFYNYYKDKGEYELLFKIVGEGPEKQNYHSLVTQYNLESYVEFCGKLEGKDLEYQYQLSDIAVSSLGLYKTGIHEVTPIKGAEYCARGIPFICGYADMRFPENTDFIMKVANSSEAIDVTQVIDFFEKIVSKDNYQERMRNYAMKHLTWDGILSPVVNALM